MIPRKEDLLPYVDNRKSAADKFDVSEKTIVNWLKRYDLYKAKPNFGCGKLDMDKALTIRRLYKEGVAMRSLAKQYGVTVATISRVVNNVIYVQIKEVAEVSVVYNPATSSGSFGVDPLAASVLSGGNS